MTRILLPLQTSWIDYPDNSSLAVTVVMMGCDNGCPFCQNPEFQNPEYNTDTKEVTVETLIKDLQDFCKRNNTDKVVLSGGDPLSCYNIEFTKEFLMKSPFDVCVFTGHSENYCKDNNVKGFKYLKCGYFDNNNKRESKKTDTYIQYASPNQKLFDENYCLLSENGVYYF